jgi:hypothetical protein
LAADYEIDLNALGISDAELAKLAGTVPGDDGAGAGTGESGGNRYEVIVECAGEAEQQAVYEKLRADGLTCSLSTVSSA